MSSTIAVTIRNYVIFTKQPPSSGSVVGKSATFGSVCATVNSGINARFLDNGYIPKRLPGPERLPGP